MEMMSLSCIHMLTDFYLFRKVAKPITLEIDENKACTGGKYPEENLAKVH